MQFLLSDQEALDALRNGIRQADGRLLIDLPETFLFACGRSVPSLVFNADVNSVSAGGRTMRLSPTQFALLRLLHQKKRVTFEDAQDGAWKTGASDSTIRAICSQVSAKLSSIGVPLCVSARRGMIYLDSLL